jgi:xaa-pro dipeptidase
VKLGTSGLINAYRTAANEALLNASVVVKQVEETIDFDFTYPMMNDVMRVVKEMQPRIIDQKFDNTCSIKLSIRKSEAEQLRMRLNKLSFEG